MPPPICEPHSQSSPFCRRCSGNLPGSYYSYEPHPRWRVVVLDAYDVSILGWPEGHPNRQAAEEILHRNNPNKASRNLTHSAGPLWVAQRHSGKLTTGGKATHAWRH